MFKQFKINYKFSLCVLIIVFFLISLLLFINNSVQALNDENHGVFAYTIKVRNAVEELDKVFERSELNVRTMVDAIAESYDTSKQKDEKYNLNFVNNIDGLTKSTLANSPGVDGSWFQLNANLPFSSRAYNWYEFKDDQFINVKNEFAGTPVVDRKITPEDDPYYYSAISNMGPVWSKIYTDTDTNAAMMTISAPIYKESILVGVAGIDISVENLKQVLSNIQSDIIQADLFLLDQDDNMIMPDLYNGRKPSDKDLEFLHLFNVKDDCYVEYKINTSKRTAIRLTLSNGYKMVISSKNSDVFSDKSTIISLLYVLYTLLILLIIAVLFLVYRSMQIKSPHAEEITVHTEENIEAEDNIE